MAKDPAVLWYWNDWHSGTILFSRHLKGCYMDLLHAQFNHGPLSLEEIKTALGSDFGSAWPSLQKKFAVDETGKYFNKRAEDEKIKRQRFTESRKNNLKKPHMNAHMKPHMEDANRNKDENLSYDVEETVLGNMIWFEQACIKTHSEEKTAKDALRMYHLWLSENDKYPKKRKSLFDGFEKWLRNERKFNAKTPAGSNSKPGTSEARNEAARNF